MKFAFWIRRKRNGPYERIEVEAKDSHEAVRKLPPCATWDFVITKERLERNLRY